ncbi:MAG: DUF983 domain-containing protein [Alphaproteobacteria bacterium]|nr:DUF983 domain-containing protein [Alphaproteobacteria bacterium]
MPEPLQFGDDQTPQRPRLRAILRGLRQRCPRCGLGTVYRRYLKVSPACGSCALALDGHKADDAPPYFTIMIVGHIVIAGMLSLETTAQPPAWVHYALWVPLTLGLSLWLLPPVKGALIGLQWAFRMHGFEDGKADS